ncbi:MAG: hypothetical protein ACI9AR_000422 [Flavobacteriaceae bacterium]|jgi:hypothetical protein
MSIIFITRKKQYFLSSVSPFYCTMFIKKVYLEIFLILLHFIYMFKKLKQKAMGMAMRSQMKKQGVPADQQDAMVKFMTENPELFEKIGKEIQHLIKSGKPQMAATMEVMKKYKDQLKGLGLAPKM